MADKPTSRSKGNPGKATAAAPTKRKRAAPGQGARTLAAKRKAQEALTLRMAGLGYDEIAKRVGYANRGTAWKVVEKALAEARQEKADQVLELELARLDRMQQRHFLQAASGDRAATHTVLKIMDRRARYLSLDNPKMTDAVAEGTTLLAALAAQIGTMPDTYVPVDDDEEP